MQDNKKVWNPRHDTVTHWLLELYTKNSFRIFWTFWKFPAWMWAKLAPICSKSHLQHDSVPFFPLALQQHICYLQHICSGMRRNRFFYFFAFSFFYFFLSFCVRDWPSTGLASSLNASEKASSRWAIFTMEKVSVVAGNSAPRFSLTFLSIFVHIVTSIEPITLICVMGKIFSSYTTDADQMRWRHKWNKGQCSSRPVAAGTGDSGLKSLQSAFHS